MAKAWFDAVNISCTAKPTVAGRPWPPYSASQVIARPAALAEHVVGVL